MSITLNANLREAAADLVRTNIEAEPAIIKAYLFPSDQEIRLVYVDPTTSPLHAGEQIAPFYFGASSSRSASYTAAIALVLPEEAENAQLPKDWGKWSDAEILWENS